MNYGESGDEVFRRAWGSIGTAVAGFALVMVAGTIGYKSFGGASMTWIDALYMTFLMVATIGYGAGLEIFHNPKHEIFTMVLAFSGIGVMTYFFSSVTALVLASDFDTAMRRRRMEKHIRKVRGHYILCGFGRVGRNVAHGLSLLPYPARWRIQSPDHDTLVRARMRFDRPPCAPLTRA